MSNLEGTPYVYSPLRGRRHIRIAALQPSVDHEAPIRVSFSDVELSEAVNTYEAISYTWGESHLVCPLYLEHAPSSEGESYILMTENLREALRRFRRRKGARRLWADAICINQADDLEKEIQIPLMVSIFRTASHVLAYISSKKEDEVALQALQDWAGTTLQASVPSLEPIPSLVIQPNTVSALSQANKILQLRWFSRRWIIQEIVFNTGIVLVCGSKEMQWDDFVHLLLYSTLYTEHPQARSQAIYLVDSLRKRHSTSIRDVRSSVSKRDRTILWLLNNFQSYSCTDDRDRIYALASMASDLIAAGDLFQTGSIHMKIDYSLDVRQTYETFALACMAAEQAGRKLVQSQQGLLSSDYTTDILECTLTRQFASRPYSWPSWVPDWRHTPLEEPSRSHSLFKDSVRFQQKWEGHGVVVSLMSYWAHPGRLALGGGQICVRFPAILARYDRIISKDGVQLFEEVLAALSWRQRTTFDLPCAVLTALLTESFPRTNLPPTDFYDYLFDKVWQDESIKPAGSYAAHDHITALNERGCLFTARDEPYGQSFYLGFGNKAFESGDKLFSFDRKKFDGRETNVYVSEAMHSALILRPLAGKCDPWDGQVRHYERYRLIGTACVIGPFRDGRLLVPSTERTGYATILRLV